MKNCIIPLMFLLFGCAPSSNIDIVPTKAYPDILKDLEIKRNQYHLKYLKALPEEKPKVINEVKTYLFHQLTAEIFPSWYGTPWDFNGITETPQEGHIACGYFVTTTLRDLGFKIPRVKWAQAASETMIVAATDDVKRFSNVEMKDVYAWLQAHENTIFIVGLDNHTGYVYNNGTEILFVHSSPFNKSHGVVAEPVMEHSPLTVSKYRVFGRILTDEMIISWMEKKAF